MIENHLQVEGHKNLIRDRHSKAILVHGPSAEHEAHKRKNARIRELEARVDSLEKLIRERLGVE